MTDLEHQLELLAADLEWPPTPSLETHLPTKWGGRRESHLPTEWGGRRESHLPTEWGGRRASAGWGAGTRSAFQSRWAIAAVAVILALAALLAYQPSRDAIAGWLNLHTVIRTVPTLKTPSPQPAGPLGARLGLGGATTLADAQKKVSWRVALPSTLGAPDEVYVQPPTDAPAQGEVTLVYGTRPGIPVAGQTGVSVLITEARGTVNQDFFGKMIGPGATLEQVSAAGHQGYWIAGPMNVFFFIDASGNPRSETVRLAADTLILDDGGTIVRIEGDLTRAQALAIAASLS